MQHINILLISIVFKFFKHVVPFLIDLPTLYFKRIMIGNLKDLILGQLKIVL